jgi:CheY-like chemotaxis protein
MLQHVCVVDDDASYRDLIALALEDYLDCPRVSRYDCGQGMLRAFSEHEAVDAILLDLHMPRLDGDQVARELRARGCRARIVILSAALGPQDTQRCLSAGAEEVFVKPDSLDGLVHRLRATFLHGPGAREPAP